MVYGWYVVVYGGIRWYTASVLVVYGGIRWYTAGTWGGIRMVYGWYTDGIRLVWYMPINVQTTQNFIDKYIDILVDNI